MTIDPLRLSGLTVSDLNGIARILVSGNGYEVYSIPKRRGGERTIYQPVSSIDNLLKRLRLSLEESLGYDPPSCVHGFVKGRSIKTNATCHLGKPVLLTMDLRDFFPSISRERIERALCAENVANDVSASIAEATTLQNELPQGFSTSPYLSNLAFEPTDHALQCFADSNDLVYTRFADDLTFSGEDLDDDTLAEITALLESCGWHVNGKKTRFMRKGGPQYVTGLYVGDSRGPHVPRATKRRIRQQLYYMSKYDWQSSHERGRAMYRNQAEGWVRYIGYIEPRHKDALVALLDQIDFSEDYLYWANPDDWDGLLRELGF